MPYCLNIFLFSMIFAVIAVILLCDLLYNVISIANTNFSYLPNSGLPNTLCFLSNWVIYVFRKSNLILYKEESNIRLTIFFLVD